MGGHINQAMANGIDQSEFVVVFATRKYMDKCNSPNHQNDNCKTEFDYGWKQKAAAGMIPVAFEPHMLDPKAWVGSFGAGLGAQLYVPLAHADLPTEVDVRALVAEIAK